MEHKYDDLLFLAVIAIVLFTIGTSLGISLFFIAVTPHIPPAGDNPLTAQTLQPSDEYVFVDEGVGDWTVYPSPGRIRAVKFNWTKCNETARGYGENCSCSVCGGWAENNETGFYNQTGCYYRNQSPANITRDANNLTFVEFLNRARDETFYIMEG